MKTIKISLLAIVAVLLFSCDKSDENEVQPIDIKAALAGKIWRFNNITGKVNNGNVNGEVTILKDGKNQYNFWNDLQDVYQFDENGILWINSTEFKWELSTDNKTILIGEKGKEKDVQIEILSVTDNELKISQKGWEALIRDNPLTNSIYLNMDVTIIMNGSVIDPSSVNTKSILIGKTWFFKTISGKVLGGKISEDVTIFKDGKNQYGFDRNLSKSTYFFKENGNVEVSSSFTNNTTTLVLKWGITGDNRKIKIWDRENTEWIFSEWEVLSIKDGEITIRDKKFDNLRTTDKTLIDSFNITLDATIVLVNK